MAAFKFKNKPPENYAIWFDGENATDVANFANCNAYHVICNSNNSMLTLKRYDGLLKNRLQEDITIGQGDFLVKSDGKFSAMSREDFHDSYVAE